MFLKYIGKDKSLKLDQGKVYDVEIHANYEKIWVNLEWPTRILSIPYDSIRALLESWEEL